MSSPVADHVVDALIAASLVDPALRQDSIGVVAGVLRAPEELPGTAGAPAGRSLPQLVEVVAYLGGALVLAAGGLFVVQQGDDLGFGAQVALLAVVTAVLALAGGVASRVPSGGPALLAEVHDSRRRLAATLLTGSALTLAFLVGLVVERQLDSSFPDVYWPGVLGAAVGVVVAAVAYRVAPSAVGLVGMMAGAVTAVMTAVNGIDDYEGDAIGASLCLVALVWLGLSERGLFREVTVARALGVSTALVSAQVPVLEGMHPWHGYLLTLAVAVVGIVVYVGGVAWPYLAAAVIAVTLVVPEAVADWTDDSLGAIGAVLVTGVTLLLASFVGYRVRAQAID